ncbi:MAG: signal peptide peptidase SppA [Nitrospirota bacterium]
MNKRPLLRGITLFVAFGMLFFLLIYTITLFVETSPVGENKIAIVRVEGMITESADIIEQLNRYNENPSVKAIIIRINSPGGGVVPSQEIYKEVKNIKKQGKKSIIVSMGTLAASGGYYIASSSDRIFANPGTITGSIGVIMELANVEGFMKMIGIENIVIKSGEFKDMASPFRKMKEKEKKILQNVIDDIHEQFIEAVAEGRGLPIEDVRKIADGRIFTGRQAIKLGLIDELGNLQEAVKRTAELVGIKEEPKIIEKKKRFSFFELFKTFFGGRLNNIYLPFRISYLAVI